MTARLVSAEIAQLTWLRDMSPLATSNATGGSLADFGPRITLSIPTGGYGGDTGQRFTVTDWSFAGPVTDGLTALLDRVDVKWFEDDGVIRFRGEGQ